METPPKIGDQKSCTPIWNSDNTNKYTATSQNRENARSQNRDHREPALLTQAVLDTAHVTSFVQTQDSSGDTNSGCVRAACEGDLVLFRPISFVFERFASFLEFS